MIRFDEGAIYAAYGALLCLLAGLGALVWIAL